MFTGLINSLWLSTLSHPLSIVGDDSQSLKPVYLEGKQIVPLLTSYSLAGFFLPQLIPPNLASD